MIGVWEIYVNYLLGGNFGASFQAITVEYYRVQLLETTYFTASPTYPPAACSTPGVRSFLEGTRYAPVYMVIGLKIVHGPNAEVTSRRSTVLEGHENMGTHELMGDSPFAMLGIHEGGDVDGISDELPGVVTHEGEE